MEGKETRGKKKMEVKMKGSKKKKKEKAYLGQVEHTLPETIPLRIKPQPDSFNFKALNGHKHVAVDPTGGNHREFFLFLKTSLNFCKASFSIPMTIRISVFHFSSSVKTLPRYLIILFYFID